MSSGVKQVGNYSIREWRVFNDNGVQIANILNIGIFSDYYGRGFRIFQVFLITYIGEKRYLSLQVLYASPAIDVTSKVINLFNEATKKKPTK